MKLAIQSDFSYRPDQWCIKFQSICANKNIDYEIIDLYSQDFSILNKFNGLIGRFGHSPAHIKFMKPNYYKICQLMNNKIFPTYKMYYYYDDKEKQFELFNNCGYPIPETVVYTGKENINIDFPVVFKKTCGAGSSNVRLIHKKEDLKDYGIVQRYYPNDSDIRITIIGHRGFWYKRLNRPNDFRASGSGRVEYTEIPYTDCLNIAYKISQDNNFKCMAYDFIQDDKGNWVLLEMSYCFVDYVVKYCLKYYDFNQNKILITDKFPEEFIIEDFVKEHFND